MNIYRFFMTDSLPRLVGAAAEDVVLKIAIETGKSPNSSKINCFLIGMAMTSILALFLMMVGIIN